MKRFLSLIFAGLLIPFSVVLFGQSSVSAVSDYDSLQTVSNLQLVSSDGSKSRQNLETSYISVLQTCSSTGYNALITAQQSEHSAWFVNQVSWGDEKYISITWSSDARNALVDWSQSESFKSLSIINYGSSVTLTTAYIFLDNDDQIFCSYNESTQNNIWHQNLSYQNYWTKPFVAYGLPITYPEGYQGQLIPDTFITPSTLRPNISYSVDDKDIILFSRKNSNLPIPDYKIKWLITNATTDANPEQEQYTLDGYSLPDQRLEFNVPFYGDWIIYAQYANSDGSLMSSWQDDTLGQSSITLRVNGTVYDANTDNMTCDEDGHCQYVPPPLYKDCSVYDITDVFSVVSCYVSNFQTWLIQTIKWLFVPDFISMNYEFNKLSNNFKESMGLLWSPFGFVISTFQLFTGTVINPTGNYCNIGSFSVFGSSSVPLELCRWRDQIPALWSTMQLIIRAGISLGLVFMFWSLFRTRVMGWISESENEDEPLTGHEYVNDGKDGRPRRS